MKIVTLTMNPAFDVHCSAESFSAGRENIASVSSRTAGGKGVNISKALLSAGVDNTALIVTGAENADEFLADVRRCGVRVSEIRTEGRIRENITLHVPGEKETRLSFKGFPCTDRNAETVQKSLMSLLAEGDILTVTGRVPDGVSVSAVKRMILALREKGIKTVIDSRSFSLADILECRPFLIKPNEEELPLYIDETKDSLINGLCGLYEKGVENVMVSLGEKGGILVCRKGAFEAVPPKICVQSTVGAGDSMIAGFLAAYTAGEEPERCLVKGVAFGTAACITEGTAAPDAEEAKKIEKETKLEIKRCF